MHLIDLLLQSMAVDIYPIHHIYKHSEFVV